MPNTPSILNEHVYRALRKQGMSKGRAARISNAQAHKDAGSVAGASLSGPGGLLGTPSLGATRRKGRKWGTRTKATLIKGNLYRANTGQFSAGGGDAAAAPATGKKPRTPRKIAQTPDEKRATTEATHAANTAKVLEDMGIPAAGQAALAALRAGAQPDPKAVEAGGFEQAGLVERATDGSYRMTASGRAAMAAAAAGDAGRAGGIISSARDRLGARTERTAASAAKRAAAQARREQVAARREAAAKKRRIRTKEQSAQQRAMFAHMGGGGGGGGSGGSGGAGGARHAPTAGQARLWDKGPDGKRTPQAGFANEGKPRAADPGKPAHGQTVGVETKAYGADPSTSYKMRHELVDMGDIHASNTVGGGINPKYDPALQPRDRSRASSQAQIAEVAQKMNPDVLTTDFHRIDSGSPIIDAHGNVLSGNGRTLALQRAAEMHPDKYADYKASVRAQAREAGIDPAAVDGMKNPVLVRRLEPGVDTAAFAREANSSGTLRMSPLEQAKVDAGGISNPHMLKLHVVEGTDIDHSLRAKENKPFIDDFLASVPPNERANLLTRNGDLNQMGLYRVKAAVYTRAFPGAHGERMAESMLESLDPDVKQIQNGISGGLPALSHAQSLIRSGQREAHLDISEDLAKTIDVYARIKDNVALTSGTPANRVVAKYLGQTSMFGRELNAEQERLLVHVDTMSRSPTKVRSFLERYARIVTNEPQPGQGSLFGDAGSLTRAQLFDALLRDDATVKTMRKAKRPMRGDLPTLPPVRKRADYGDIKAGDLVMALFHNKIAPHDAMRADTEQATKSFIVYKDHAGTPRWLARTTTAYRDRDNEIISADALDQDSARMTATKTFGPLRYWHVGDPDPFAAVAPWGPGLDIGDCDYSALIGRTRMESGTFRNPAIAAKIARQADQYELSPGFFHPLDQPDAQGVFNAIRTFERSLVPTRYARASNLFTGLAVKEQRMDIAEMERRFKAAITDLGLDTAQAAALGAQLVQTEKSAAAQGIAFKSEGADDAPDMIINGVTYKAFPPKAAAPPPDGSPMDAEDDPAMGGDSGADEATEAGAPDAPGQGDYIGDMSWAEFAAKLGELLAPVLKMQEMVKTLGDAHGELKTMYGGAATKTTSELTTLKAQYAELAAKIATIEGDQPAVVLPDDVAEALKSAGPAKPATPATPMAEAINDPARPWAGWAAHTFPELYQTTGDN